MDSSSSSTTPPSSQAADPVTQVQPTIATWLTDKIAEYIREYKEGGLLNKQVLSPDQIRDGAYTLLGLATLEDRLRLPENRIYRELEFFTSNDPSGQTPSLFQRLDTTSTVSGSLYLANHLLNHTDNLETLHQRQNTIQYFSTLSTGESGRLTALINEFKAAEPDLYWLTGKKTAEMSEVLQILFFNQPWNQFLNTNDQFTCLYYYFIMIFNPIWGVFGPILIFFIPYVFTRYVMKIEIPLDFYLQSLKSTLFGDQFFKMFKMAQKVYQGVTATASALHTGSDSLKSFVVNKIFEIITSEFGRWVYLGIVIGCYLWSIYNQCLTTYNYNKLINFLHVKLNRVRQLITSVNTAIQITGFSRSTTGRSIADSGCPVYTRLQNECLAALNTNEVIKYIREQATFTQTPGILSNKGAIIKAYYLLDKDPTILRPFIEFMAYLDTWTSMARHSASWCIPTYNPISEYPQLEIRECFSPACQPCITNDVHLLAKGSQNMLLTGPNGSGKSTYLKSVMSAVILAQTIGIAPAESMQFTPFAHLSTYLNIPDCQGKESLFQAEMTRCHDHLAMLKDLESQPGKFSFNIMDEIFVSTNYLEGMSGAYAVIKSLGQLNNSLHIITTHFDKLTNPEQPIPGYVYKHFTISTDPADESVIQKDYKLRDGVNRKHMALHLLKLRGFDSTLITDAREMYDRLVSADDAIRLDSSSIPMASAPELPTKNTATPTYETEQSDENHEIPPGESGPSTVDSPVTAPENVSESVENP